MLVVDEGGNPVRITRKRGKLCLGAVTVNLWLRIAREEIKRGRLYSISRVIQIVKSQLYKLHHLPASPTIFNAHQGLRPSDSKSCPLWVNSEPPVLVHSGSSRIPNPDTTQSGHGVAAYHVQEVVCLLPYSRHTSPLGFNRKGWAPGGQGVLVPGRGFGVDS